MMTRNMCVFKVVLLFHLYFSFSHGGLLYRNSKDYKYTGSDVGSPLFLTPYIEAGNLDEARKLSQVLDIDGVTQPSFSGYFTVNKTFSSNMFFWFWPAQNYPETAPILLWLQGGPGGSSIFGLFVENGPYFINTNYKAEHRDVSWNKNFSLLYIDNPVGTGYSFTLKEAGFATSQGDVARDLYSALTQFFILFPKLSENDFYITGESYAGKYIPAIAAKIHKENPSAKVFINLKGAAIGDGFTDPVSMIPLYPNLLYTLGMFDENERDLFQTQLKTIVNDINVGNYLNAFRIFDKYFNGDLYPYTSYFTNVTGSTNYDNFLRTTSPPTYYEKFVTSPAIREAIHVGNLTYNSGQAVEQHMLNDFFKSEKDDFVVLLNNYRVLVYNGQLDIIVAPLLTQTFLLTVPWKGLEDYKQVTKKVWRMNATDVSGYARHVRDFYQVIVRNGGHIVPRDQPERCLDMLTRFIYKQSF